MTSSNARILRTAFTFSAGTPISPPMFLNKAENGRSSKICSSTITEPSDPAEIDSFVVTPNISSTLIDLSLLSASAVSVVSDVSVVDTAKATRLSRSMPVLMLLRTLSIRVMTACTTSGSFNRLNSNRAVCLIKLRARSGSCTPASSTIIRFDPCLSMVGSETPNWSTLFRITSRARLTASSASSSKAEMISEFSIP